MAEEAGDDDFGDMGSMGTPVAHTHHTGNSMPGNQIPAKQNLNLMRDDKKSLGYFLFE